MIAMLLEQEKTAMPPFTSTSMLIMCKALILCVHVNKPRLRLRARELFN